MMRGAIETRAGLPRPPQTQPAAGFRRLPVEGLLDHGLAWENRPPGWPWIMVPAGETRALALGTGLPIAIDNVDAQGQLTNWMKMPVYQARATRNQIFITGRSAFSNAPLDVRVPGAALRIWVSVKPRMTLPVIAHYVEHGPLLKTRTTPDHVRQMIAFANGILAPQTNVRLQLAMQRVLSHKQIGKDLGAVIRYDPENPEKDDEPSRITRHKLEMPAGKLEFPALNLFLVREVSGKGVNELAHVSPDGCCIFEDRVFERMYFVQAGGETLAHEAGHYLRFLANAREALALSNGDAVRRAELLKRFYGIDDHRPSDPQNLMSPGKYRRGTRLDRGQIERFNPTRPYANDYPRSPSPF